MEVSVGFAVMGLAWQADVLVNGASKVNMRADAIPAAAIPAAASPVKCKWLTQQRCTLCVAELFFFYIPPSLPSFLSTTDTQEFNTPSPQAPISTAGRTYVPIWGCDKDFKATIIGVGLIRVFFPRVNISHPSSRILPPVRPHIAYIFSHR